MGHGQRSVIRALGGLLAFFALGVRIAMLMLAVIVAAADPELPGNEREYEASETWVCIQCHRRVVPNWPESGGGPECPTNPAHTLIPR
jgi:hypothetical protein